MREDFLHYIWKFRKFDISNLQTVNHEPIIILNPGNYLQLAGPDFFNAHLVVGNQEWAGNVEIHLRSSDWYAHHHEKDRAYDNVILHVVWEHDTAVFRKNNTEIPVLELKGLVNPEAIARYEHLKAPKTWIYCEKQIAEVDGFVIRRWQERLFFERLERKCMPISELFDQTGGDWEAVLFCLLAKNFGLNANGDAFLKISKLIPFSIIRKECAKLQHLEALLFGFAGLLAVEKEDHYFKAMKSTFSYLCQKYQLDSETRVTVDFFKHRPDNFPTIRLSQLAAVYNKERSLFSAIIGLGTSDEIYAIFAIKVSTYWKSHYQFDRESRSKNKLLSRSFIDLLIINTIVPVRFAYAKSQGKEISDSMFGVLQQIKPESNAVIQKFGKLGIKAETAFESQALLQLRNEYCAVGKCLGCEIGLELLKPPKKNG